MEDSKEKQIEEMAKDLDACPFLQAPIGCDQHEGSIAIAEYLYNAGYRKSSDLAEEIFAEIDDFQRTLRHIFLDMCGGNDYNTLNLLQIDNAIEALFDTRIAELKKKYTEGGE